MNVSLEQTYCSFRGDVTDLVNVSGTKRLPRILSLLINSNVPVSSTECVTNF